MLKKIVNLATIHQENRSRNINDIEEQDRPIKNLQILYAEKYLLIEKDNIFIVYGGK